MTISGALNNAMSGLRAASRATQLVSSNISNAMTPGYGRRELALSPQSLGGLGGVRIDGITRIVDEGLAGDIRLASAEQEFASATAGFFGKLENLLGKPDDPFSYMSSLSTFENRLISAASRPDAPERLTGALDGVRELASSLKRASDGVQDARSNADRTIEAQVTQLNNALKQVQSLNSQITALQSQSGDPSALQDHRQQVVAEISELVPVRLVPRDNGQIALYTTGGAILIDGRAAEVGFTPVNVVTPYMSVEANTLSGLTINGAAIRTGSEDGALRGGAIAAQFAIRDEYSVEAQAQIDALARDLVERFQDPAVDPSLAAGDAGLFTDDGAAFDAPNEVGLAQRLSLNARVDPRQGGEAWRLRDGIGAAAPGEVGNATLLQAMGDTLRANRVPASGGFGGAAYTAIDLVTNVASSVGAQQTTAEQLQTYASARFSEMLERQLADGVDTDDELQNLMLLEQTYAANARMLQVVDEMIETILRL